MGYRAAPNTGGKNELNAGNDHVQGMLMGCDLAIIHRTCGSGHLHFHSPIVAKNGLAGMRLSLVIRPTAGNAWCQPRVLQQVDTATASHFAPAKFDGVDATRRLIQISRVNRTSCLEAVRLMLQSKYRRGSVV